MMVLRSMLFMPGNKTKILGKAPSTTSDAVILDLEDSVPMGDKANARTMVRDATPLIKQNGVIVFVRINSIPTKITRDDLQTIIAAKPDGVMLAKAESKSDIIECDHLLSEAEKTFNVEAGSTRILPIIESAKGVVFAYEIAAASKRVIGLAFGAGDYCKDLGRNASFVTPQQTELLFARSQIVNCSIAAGVQPIDTVYFGVLTDMDAYTRECNMGLQLGFKGKALIHPNQIEIANTTFSPSPAETDYARRLVAAFSEAKNKGSGALQFEGKMVDEMSYQQALALTKFSEIIAEKAARRTQAK